MNIVVCVKRVPDDGVTVKLGADGKPAVSEITQVVDSFDTYALEMATRFKEANGGEVSVITTDDLAAATPLLRSCLSVGADKAYCVNLTDVCARGTTVAGIEHIGGADIILVGSESTDTASMEFGARISNKMGVAFVPNVKEFVPAEGGLTVKQETEDGYRVIDVPTPCVLSVVKPGYDPRYPSIKAKLAAKKMPIGEITAADLGITPHAQGHYSVVKYAAPAKRQAGVKLQEEDQTVAVGKVLGMLKERKLV